jgi:hypothetical protein
MANADKDIKRNVLKSLRDFFKDQEVGSWKSLFDGEGKKEKESDDESEDEEEECKCGKSSCPICSKPKGVMIEETIVAVKPKKK